MRSTTRPPAEWKTTGGERTAQRRRPRQDTGELSEPWPMLWIGRPADAWVDTQVYEWDEFLNKLAAKNRPKGRGRAMGSVAITYIKGVEMGQMMADKYDKYTGSRAKAVELQRRVAGNIREFMRESEYASMHVSTEQVARQRAMLKRYVDDEDGVEYLQGSDRLSLADEAQLEKGTRFAGATLAVSGLALFGRNKLGIDLSKNEQLYQERTALMGHLRSEGFNTQRMDREWHPHAVVFDYFDHISSRNQMVSYREVEMPSEIVVLRPEPGADLEVA